MHRLFALLLLVSPLVADDAQAQDIEDLDEDGSTRARKKTKKSSQVRLEGEVVREVEKGFYLKSGIGTSFYLLTYGSYTLNNGQRVSMLKSGTNLPIAFGQDFVDKEKSSMAWEISFTQGVHNGLHYEIQTDPNIPPTSYIQGDTRTFSFLASYEYSVYPGRRFGIGIRVGGGVMLSPLLMDREAYVREVVDAWTQEPSVHNEPHPIGFGGPTFEYYTKLSHFSIGADVDVGYAVGFDLGISANGYMKYSF